MPSRVTAVGIFRWGIVFLVVGMLAAGLPYSFLGGSTVVGTMVFQWTWNVLLMLQYVGAGMVAVGLGVRALEGRLGAQGAQGVQPDQALGEPGPYGPGGGHPNPQP